MAAATQKKQYQSHKAGYSDGNLAHDLDWAVRERELRHAGEAPRHPSSEVRRPTKQRTLPKMREREHISPFTLIGGSVVLILATLVVMSYIQLTTIAIETVELKHDLEELESEHAALTAQYEQMFDLASVREAAEAAGMTKPSSSQICYLDISDGDTTVVYESGEPSLMADMAESLQEYIYNVVEYFN